MVIISGKGEGLIIITLNIVYIRNIIQTHNNVPWD